MTEQSTYNRPSRYAMIPEWVIYHPDLTGSDVRVYAVMARMADAEGRCYPKADTVASRLNVSDDTVRRSIARLEAAGALRVEPKMGAGGYRSNDFLIAGDTPLTNKITPERAKQKADAEANGRKSAAAGGCRNSAATAAATVRRQVPQICGDKEGEPSLNENQLNENQIFPSTVPVEDPFDRFWQHYPRKVSRRSPHGGSGTRPSRAGWMPRTSSPPQKPSLRSSRPTRPNLGSSSTRTCGSTRDAGRMSWSQPASEPPADPAPWRTSRRSTSES